MPYLNARFQSLRAHAQAAVESITQGARDPGLAALQSQRKIAELFLDARIQSDSSLTHRDIENLPHLVAAENHRNPGLNLHCFSQPKALRDFLVGIANESDRDQVWRGRAIFRVDDACLHHAVADIYHEPGGTLSIIIPDSTLADSHLGQTLETGLNMLGVACVVSADGSAIQKSNYDCVMFSLSFALKLQDHELLFDRYHQRQIAEHTERWTMRHDGLPAAFYKHSHSKSGLEWALKRRPALHEEIVNKVGENLQQRQSRLSGEYLSSSDYTPKVFSNSIERKRVVFLDRAITHRAAHPAEPVESALQRKLSIALIGARAKMF